VNRSRLIEKGSWIGTAGTPAGRGHIGRVAADRERIVDWNSAVDEADGTRDMKTWLEIQRADGIETREVIVHRDPLFGSEHGIAEGTCPGCNAQPFRIHGHGIEKLDAETVRAGSRCMSCKDPVGWCYARTETLFGVEEDEAVILHARARVYA